MINGEDTHDESAGVPSLDLLDQFPHKDGSDDASPASSARFSSCGESEFERYCSANSLMGTPSMCSSTGPFLDSLESEFGSFKAGFASGDATEFENFSLGPSSKLYDLEIGRSSDRRTRFSVEDTVKGCDNQIIGIPSGTRTGNEETIIKREDVNDKGTLERDSVDHFVGEGSEECLCGSDSRVGGQDGGREDEHSGSDDDSICDSDGGSGKISYPPWNLQHKQTQKAEDNNLFLINSSTAFGTNDWDDFELEAMEAAEDPLEFCSFQTLDKKSNESKGPSSKSFSAALPTIPAISQPGRSQDQADIPVNTECAQDADDMKGSIEDTLAPTASGSLVSTVFNQREQSGEPRDGLILAQSLTTGGSLVDSYNETRETSVVMNYLRSNDADDVLVIIPNELADKDSVIQEPFGTQDVVAFPAHNSDASGVHWHLDPNVSSGLLHQSHAYGKMPNSSTYGDYPSKSSSASGNHLKPLSNDSHPVANAFEVAHPQPKKENTELNDFYDDFVHDMEEILLDSGESSGAMFSKSDKMFQLQLSLPERDGGQTATTSGGDDSSPIIFQRLRINGVEVIGAKQKKGDVSLSERLVGVREYTVYIIRVWSGKDKWEVERRYRDFYTLYRRLASLFADQGWTLPPPWASVERESRKIFGTSPHVIAERSVLIQDCLNSALQYRRFPTPPNVLLRFLSLQDTFASPSGPDSVVSPSGSAGINGFAGTSSTFGNTISLMVEIRSQKSVKQLLESQHHICAGCHRYFDDGATLVRDFVKALGWGKPRLCEYTGQLFCSSCHTNETAVLPAKVLHHWDFGLYPVSQLAKSYLDSIHEQPMLCVSAVNPFLFSKVPALNQVMTIRKRITVMLPYVRCPFRKTLNRGLGSRRYLLESTDFFALKDLIDLSKGAFAALPMMVEIVSRKIREHITEQCLVCCDVGVPCNARRACDDTSSLIFPFQNSRTKRLRNALCVARFSTRSASRGSRPAIAELHWRVAIARRRRARIRILLLFFPCDTSQACFQRRRKIRKPSFEWPLCRAMISSRQFICFVWQ
ncbi:PREDICTED: uncharacterized protein LOC104798972 isoform X2 [Tarenaya hassleriana]|uniref:uncharacterized protein LOC104798972 isoform X2 n=1 Tax=Tarenaya hassleriana TaxID=28532 RepID=UPI00053C7F3B|nr:PREDICTED: uncharacterized protein LOC104798972 isoform X2 [Tarenaya hassleriana]